MKKSVEEAIKLMKIENACNYFVLHNNDIIESYNIAISALEKQIPQKIIKFDKYYYKCPVCGMGTGVSEEDMLIYETPQPHYCSNCGQALGLEW